jgi:putative colanic acid biosynthesis UDP-glucose lipid carrier transferase
MDYLAIDPALQTWSVATPFLLVTAQWATRAAFLVSARVHKSSSQAVIIGMNELGLRLAREIRRNPLNSVHLLGFFDEREIDRLGAHEGEPLLGKPHDLPDFLKTHNVRLVYIALPMARQERILDLLDKLRDSTASIYFVPDLFITDLIQARFDRVGSLPVVAVCDSPFRGLRGVVKRASDIAFPA